MTASHDDPYLDALEKVSTGINRYHGALEWISTGTIPARHGGQSGTATELAEFARAALNDPVPHKDCPYCRGDGVGCPACAGARTDE